MVEKMKQNEKKEDTKSVIACLDCVVDNSLAIHSNTLAAIPLVICKSTRGEFDSEALKNLYINKGYVLFSFEKQTNQTIIEWKNFLKASQSKILKSMENKDMLNGIPDLFIYKSDEDYCFIELKKGKDQLRLNQVVWAIRHPNINKMILWIVEEIEGWMYGF